jgi:hypothetical protein
VRFETNTYVLFWQGGDPYAFIALEDQLQAACPWLRGYASGGTPHPAPADDPTIGDLQPGDGFDFAGATQHQGIPFAAFPATTQITRLELRTTGVHVEFRKKDGVGRWPDVGDPAPCDNGISGQVHGNWFYANVWGPLQRQPAVGELVGFFVVAGNVRGVGGADIVKVSERSNVVVVPFPDVHGAVFGRKT